MKGGGFMGVPRKYFTNDHIGNILKVMKWAKITLCLISLLLPTFVFAHPGRTDNSGCHTCRTNCASWGLDAGEYHCHNAKTLPQPVEPIKSTYGENGTGYTTPAPEYKAGTANTGQVINASNINQRIKDQVEQEKRAYYKNPHWFRENLISKLEKEFGKSSVIGNYIYTLLPDIK